MYRRDKHIPRDLYDDMVISAAPYFFMIKYVQYNYDTENLEIYGEDLQAMMEYMNDLNDQIVLLRKVFHKPMMEKKKNVVGMTNNDFRKFYT